MASCCDAKSFEEQCSECAQGAFAPDAHEHEHEHAESPEESALRWGIDVARSQGVGGFWRAHTVAEVYRRSGFEASPAARGATGVGALLQLEGAVANLIQVSGGSLSAPATLTVGDLRFTALSPADIEEMEARNRLRVRFRNGRLSGEGYVPQPGEWPLRPDGRVDGEPEGRGDDKYPWRGPPKSDKPAPSSSVAPERRPRGGSPGGEPDGEDERPDPGGGGGGGGPPPFDPDSPPWEPYEYSNKCCVKEFIYPEYLMEKNVKNDDGTWNIGTRFWSRAEFKDQGVCDCSCCEFRQFVRVDYTWTEYGREYELKSPGTHQEDCSVMDANGDRVGPAVGQGSGQVPVPKGGRSKCFGRGDDNARGYDPVEEYTENDCKYRMVDTPGLMTVPVGATYDINADFIGRIYDRCRGWVVKRTERFRIRRKGRLSTLGPVEGEESHWRPYGGKRWKPKNRPIPGEFNAGRRGR